MKKLITVMAITLMLCLVLAGCKKVEKIFETYDIGEVDEEEKPLPIKIKTFDAEVFFTHLEERIGEINISEIYLTNFLGDSSKGSFRARWKNDLTLDELYFEFTIKESKNKYHVYTCKYAPDNRTIVFEKAREESSEGDQLLEVKLNEILGTFLNTDWGKLIEQKDFPFEDYYYLSVRADNSNNTVLPSTTYDQRPSMTTAEIVYAIDKTNTTITILDASEDKTRFPRKSFCFTVNGQTKSGDNFRDEVEILVCPEMVNVR